MEWNVVPEKLIQVMPSLTSVRAADANWIPKMQQIIETYL